MFRMRHSCALAFARNVSNSFSCSRRFKSSLVPRVTRHKFWVSHYRDDLYDVGLTEEFLKEALPEGCVGSTGEFNFDIERIDVLADPRERTEMCKGNLLSAGPDTTLIEIEWSSLKRSESDEMYHAVWSNESGVIYIKRPVELSILKDHKENTFQVHSYNFEYIGRSQRPPPSDLTKIWLYRCKLEPSFYKNLI